MSKKAKLKLAVIDIETDPFRPGKMVYPFLAGYYDGTKTISHWHENCVGRLVRDLQGEDPSLIYVHNGGRFDFEYFLPYFNTSRVKIINGDLVEAKLGRHTMRDSYKILPMPLRDYDKDDIDYNWFLPHRRNAHRETICNYFQKDLTALYELVAAFHREFGNHLTIGMASMKQLEQFHPFKRGNADFDRYFRKYYFGGRVQAFQGGIIKGPIRVLDVNSMYPNAMANVRHPVGLGHTISNRVSKSTVFLDVDGTNYGAFPVRAKTGGLDFTVPNGIFHTTIHEFHAAIETGSFRVKRILKTYDWRELSSFDRFVLPFYQKRQQAIAAGDKIRDLLYKFILNAASGKFAQDPSKYFDWVLAKKDDGYPPPDCAPWHECTNACDGEVTNKLCPKCWYPAMELEHWWFWKRVTRKLSFYNVATGASITGAGRAQILRGLCSTPEPLYCDTDSIISRGPSSIPVDQTGLGQWKLEKTGDSIAIGGKKIYALFRGPDCVKLAHKGMYVGKSDAAVAEAAREILSIAKGGTVDNLNPVPRFHMGGEPTFTKRTIRSTFKPVPVHAVPSRRRRA